MSLTKMWDLHGTDLEIEMTSNGWTTLWRGEKILGVYPNNIIDQELMCEKIKTLFPNWKEGMITRKQ